MNYKISNINELNDNIILLVNKSLSNEDILHMKKMPKSRKLHFILGRYLLMNMGVDISKITYDDRKPLHPDIFFSISHSGDYTCVIISEDNIGIDFERIREVDKNIKRNVCGNEDISDTDFLKEFTKRESFIKYNNLGLKNLNDNIDDYDFETEITNEFVITTCKKSKN